MVRIDECNKKALTELSVIISKLDIDLKEKIPKNLIKNIEENKDKVYEPNSENELLPETKALLSVIMSEYIASDKNKEKWKAYDRNYLEKVEREKMEKYNPDDLFKNRNVINDKQEKSENISVIIHKKDNFIIKVLKRIKVLFTKKK